MEKSSQNIAIIGAGIVGVSTAIWLQRAGHDVTLIDRLGPGEGTSFGNGGVLASCACVPVTVPGLIGKAPLMLLDKNAPLFLKWAYLPKLLRWLAKYLSHANKKDVERAAKALFGVVGSSLEEHQALAKDTSAAKWIEPSDYLYLYRNRAAFEADAYGWNLRKAFGFRWEELEGNQVAAYDDAFSEELNFAVKMGDHGRITDPGQYVKDLADTIVAKGGKLIIDEVKGFEIAEGYAKKIKTGGSALTFDQIVLTTGVWSKSLAAQLGVNVPLESERGYHVELWEPNFMPKAPVMNAAGKFVITPMDGRIRLAGIVEFGGLEAGPSKPPFDLLLRGLKTAMPKLEWKRTEQWMGHRPAPSDSIPLIGRAPKINNAWMAFGHHHIGLTAGPKTGRLLAQMIDGTKLNLDLAPYSPMRFDVTRSN